MNIENIMSKNIIVGSVTNTLEEMEDILKANFDERTWIKKKK